MVHRFRTAAAGLAMWTLFAGIAQARPAGQAAAKGDAAQFAKTDAIFADLGKPGAPGCSLAVVRAGKVVYAKGYGLANLEHAIPNTRGTVFDIGSTSKQFTAACVVLLAQDGKLSLDDDVRKWLPEMPDYGKTITLRHMLHHQSGIRDYLGLMELGGRSVANDWPEEWVLQLIARQKALDFLPGEKFSYSNSNYFLMSLVVKRAAGMSMAAFAQQRIFEPLGMDNTRFLDDWQTVVPRRAGGYTPTEKGFKAEMSIFDVIGDGALLTSVEDLAKWDGDFYAPKVGGAALWETLQHTDPLNNGAAQEYGFGLMHMRYKGLDVVLHGGAWAGYRAEMMRFPKQRITFIVLANRNDEDPTARCFKVADLWLKDAFVAGGAEDGAAEQTEPAPAQADPLADLFAAAQFTPPPADAPAPSMDGLEGDWIEPAIGVGFKLVAKGNHLAASTSQGAQLDLAPVKGGYFEGVGLPVVIRLYPGEAGFRLAVQGQTVFAFQRATATPPDAALLAALAGAFYSAELDARYDLSVKDGQLQARVAGMEEAVTLAWTGEGFGFEGAMLLPDAVADGKAPGFSVNAGRLKNVRFTRMGD